MSCFGGKMKEYGGISIDRFDNFRGNMNLKSTAYFLSHFHKDHTVGMTCERFYERLKLNRNKIFLYCTDVTRTLLIADDDYKRLGKYMKILPVGEPTVISIPDEYTDQTEKVTVTLLQAGHCPGSVMFFFEGAEGNVLYTGDFRWESNEATRMEIFKSGDSLKDIKSLYVDTTFCIPEAFYIPSRSDCVDAVYDLVQEWTAESPHHYVHISSKSKYGHEHLLKELSQKLGKKIHILDRKFQVYEQIPEIQGAFTTDPTETRVHACYWDNKRDRRSRLPCGYIPQSHAEKVRVMVIRPSTMWFTQGVQVKDIHVKTRSMHRVCYSFHSSFSEVRDLVTYLRPRRAYPNVKPLNQTMEQVQTRLNQFLRLVHKEHISRDQSPQVKPLGVLRKIKSNNIDQKVSLSDSEELCFGESITPARLRRRASSGSLPSTPSSSQKFMAKCSKLAAEPSSEESQGFNHVRESPDKSDTQSSYAPSCRSAEEMDLTADGDENQREITEKSSSLPPDGSCLAYLSGDEDDDDYVEFITQKAILSGNSPENEDSRKVPNVISTTDHSSMAEIPESRQRRHSSSDLFTDSEKSSSTKDDQEDTAAIACVNTNCVVQGPHKRKIFSDGDENIAGAQDTRTVTNGETMDGNISTSEENCHEYPTEMEKENSPAVIDDDDDVQNISPIVQEKSKVEEKTTRKIRHKDENATKICEGEQIIDKNDGRKVENNIEEKVENDFEQMLVNSDGEGIGYSCDQKVDDNSERKTSHNHCEQNKSRNCEQNAEKCSELKIDSERCDREQKVDKNCEQKPDRDDELRINRNSKQKVDNDAVGKVHKNSEQKLANSYNDGEQIVDVICDQNVDSNNEPEVSSVSEQKLANSYNDGEQIVDVTCDQKVDSNNEPEVSSVSEQKVDRNCEQKINLICEQTVYHSTEQKVVYHSTEQKVENNSEQTVDSNRKEKVHSESKQKVSNASEQRANSIIEEKEKIPEGNENDPIIIHSSHSKPECSSRKLANGISPSVIVLEPPVSPSVAVLEPPVGGRHKMSDVDIKGLAKRSCSYTEERISGNNLDDSEVSVIECVEKYTGEVFYISDDDTDDSDVTLPLPEDLAIHSSNDNHDDDDDDEDDDIEIVYSSGPASPRTMGSACYCTCLQRDLAISTKCSSQEVPNGHSRGGSGNSTMSTGPVAPCLLHPSYSFSGSGNSSPRVLNSPRKYLKLRPEVRKFVDIGCQYSLKGVKTCKPSEVVLVDLTSDSEDEENRSDKTERAPPGVREENDSGETIEYCSPAKKFCPSV